MTALIDSDSKVQEDPTPAELPPSVEDMTELRHKHPPYPPHAGLRESQLAIGLDGALYLSLDDLGRRELGDREVVKFVRLTPEEEAEARKLLAVRVSDAVSVIIGQLPLPATVPTDGEADEETG